MCPIMYDIERILAPTALQLTARVLAVIYIFKSQLPCGWVQNNPSIWWSELAVSHSKQINDETSKMVF